jgi:hypothetical protein
LCYTAADQTILVHDEKAAYPSDVYTVRMSAIEARPSRLEVVRRRVRVLLVGGPVDRACKMEVQGQQFQVGEPEQPLRIFPRNITDQSLTRWKTQGPRYSFDMHSELEA